MGWIANLFGKQAEPEQIESFEFVRRLVGAEHFVVTDSELAADAYAAIVEQLCGITDGAVQAISGPPLDPAALVEAINARLTGPNRLFSVTHETWGQEWCVVFTTPLVIQELRVADYIIEGDDDVPDQEHELSADRMIHGYLFRAGTQVEYWVDPPFDEMEVTLAAPHELAGLALPAGTLVRFKEDGTLDHAIVGDVRREYIAGTWR